MRRQTTEADGTFRTTLGAALKAAHRITELVPHTWIAGLGYGVRDVYWGQHGVVTLETKDLRLISFDSAQEITVDCAGEAMIRDTDHRQFLVGFEMVRPICADDIA